MPPESRLCDLLLERRSLELAFFFNVTDKRRRPEWARSSGRQHHPEAPPAFDLVFMQVINFTKQLRLPLCNFKLSKKRVVSGAPRRRTSYGRHNGHRFCSRRQLSPRRLRLRQIFRRGTGGAFGR